MRRTLCTCEWLSLNNFDAKFYGLIKDTVLVKTHHMSVGVANNDRRAQATHTYLLVHVHL